MVALHTSDLAPRRRRRSAWSLGRVVTVAIATIGAVVLLYPSAAAWSSDRVHATEVSGYIETVRSLPSDEIQQKLEAAHTYNEHLPLGPLRDPYALTVSGQQTAVGEGTTAYFATLDVGADGMMAHLRIPKINVDLPIYHGTDEQTLARGIGHLYGTSLPVGGTGTHAVLTGHSGYVSARLLTHLDQIEIGDQFTVTVLDEVLTYQVDQIRTVLPAETADLQRVPGEDYITLVTCTPTGVNTHRLLVRGHRVPTSETQADGAATVRSQSDGPGFPWWALGMAAAPTAATTVTKPRRRR